MKYTIRLTFPSQGTRLWDCGHYAALHKCWTGLSPFAAFLSKKHTLAAPLVTHQDITMQNSKVSLLDMSSSFFIRHYLKNPLTFCFHHLLICLNSEGTFSKTGLHKCIKHRMLSQYFGKTLTEDPNRNQLRAARHCLHHIIARGRACELVFGTPTCASASEHAITTNRQTVRNEIEDINTGKTANWG